jgi:hypothetical protein
MESDYGSNFVSAEDIIDDEEEYPQSYMLDETAVVVEEVYEDEETFIPFEKPQSKNKPFVKVGKVKQPQVKQMNKKRKYQKHLTGTEQFYQLILTWDIEKLLLDNRKVLGLSLLSEMPSYFPNKLEYFETMRQVAVEEARASIYQGLKSPNGSMELKINKLHSSEDSSFLLIEFLIVKGDIEMTRPGWVFKLNSGDSNQSINNNNNRNSKNKFISANNSNINNNKTGYSHYNNSNSKSSQSNIFPSNQNIDQATIAVVAQGIAYGYFIPYYH